MPLILALGREAKAGGFYSVIPRTDTLLEEERGGQRNRKEGEGKGKEGKGEGTGKGGEAKTYVLHFKKNYLFLF